jgi:hypothetical protein
LQCYYYNIMVRPGFKLKTVKICILAIYFTISVIDLRGMLL